MISSRSIYVLCAAVVVSSFIFIQSAAAAPSLIVTTVADEDNGSSDPVLGTGTSLREAINFANSNADVSTITFNIPAAQQVGGIWTIQLASALPDLTTSVNVDGPGANLLTVRRNTGGNYRIFTCSGGFTAYRFSALTISNGNATASAPGNAYGGGVFSLNQLTLTNCVFNQNNADIGGGAVACIPQSGLSQSDFSGCTFFSNTSGKQGGAIYLQAVTQATIQNCTITGNRAQGAGLGGGIDMVGDTGSSELRVTNCTFGYNVVAAGGFGSALLNLADNGASVTTILSNNIFAGTSQSPSVQKAVGSSGGTSTLTSAGYNISTDNGGGNLTQPTDMRNVDPLLGPLQNNGGSTPTQALFTGSPALDAGNTNLAVDQRGVSRPQGSADDIGAYELAFSFVVTTTADENNGSTDPALGTGTSLREALTAANGNPDATAITFNLPEAQKVNGVWTITLSSPLPDVTGSLSINGPGAKLLNVRPTISAFRIFHIPGSGLSIEFAGLTISNGSAGTDNGGGIRSLSALTLTNCSFSGNQASSGGGVNLVSADGVFTGCTFSNNAASTNGGAFNLDGSGGHTLRVENCTISGNTGPTAVYQFAASAGSSTLQLTNCTVANSAGSAVHTQASGGASVATFLSNSVFDSNSADFTTNVAAGSSVAVTSQGYNLSSGNGSGFLTATGDVINTSANLGPLQDNGGNTPTRAIDASSPAFNTGNTSLTIDQRGFPRPRVGADDKGAFEFIPVESLIVTTTVDENNATSNPSFGTGTSLREAINWANADGLPSAITFSPTAFAGPRKTITLNAGQLGIVDDGTCSITGPSSGVEINGNNASRIFNISASASVTLTRLQISGGFVVNTAFGQGGGIFNGGALLLDSCTLSGNSAGIGGAITSSTNLGGTALTLRNCTLSGNSAGLYGGALANGAGLTTFDSCTITLNTAPAGGGGGLASAGNATTRTEVRNSIISGNASSDVDYFNGSTNSFQSNGYNLVGSGNATGEFVETGDQSGNSTPGLGPLQENGGATRTHAVLATSPAFNSGNTTLTVDQRGTSRPQSSGDDKGAFELVTVESLVVTTTADEDNGTSDPSFGTGTSLREAINRANSDGVASTITFSPAAFAAPRRTITLTGGQLPALANNGTLAITAPVAGVEISGALSSRIFNVNSDASATLTRLTLRDGQPAGSDTFGGAIFNSGILLLDGCTLSNNRASNGGAIFSFSTLSKALTLRNCTLSGNTAASAGGAILNNQGLVTLDSCTLGGNSAPANDGAGIASFAGSATRTEVHNSIISGNSSTDVDVVGGGANSFQSNGYNLIGDGNAIVEFVEPGDVNNNASPGLGPLQENGGPTPTRAVYLGSLALNTGGASSLTTDQRGLLRSSGSALDKGAYELQPESYAFWSSYIFPAGTASALLAINADADGDGIPNGLEQALALNPLAPDAASSAVQFAIQGNNLVLQYRRSALIDPARLFAEATLTLQPPSWSSTGITYANLGASSPTTELIQALIPINGAPAKFGRLRVNP